MSPTPAADPTAAGPSPERFDEEPQEFEIPRLVRVGAIAAVGALAGLTIALGWESPVRAGLVFVFMLFGPGLAVGELLQVRDPVQQLALAAGISFGIDTLIALVLLYAGVLSGGLAFAIAYAITLAALAASVVRSTGTPFADQPRRRATT
jgi:hypothetical protein